MNYNEAMIKRHMRNLFETLKNSIEFEYVFCDEGVCVCKARIDHSNFVPLLRNPKSIYFAYKITNAFDDYIIESVGKGAKYDPNKHLVFVGKAKIHKDDWNVYNEDYGKLLAYRRCYRKILNMFEKIFTKAYKSMIIDIHGFSKIITQNIASEQVYTNNELLSMFESNPDEYMKNKKHGGKNE